MTRSQHRNRRRRHKERQKRQGIIPVPMQIVPVYERLTTFSIEQGFGLIRQSLLTVAFARSHGAKIQEFIFINGEKVKTASMRLASFLQNGVNCNNPECNVKGAFFAAERGMKSHSPGYHINLYGFGVDGNEVMMTHDHIVARSLGGADALQNTQTLCTHCNSQKSCLEGLIRKLLKEKHETQSSH